MILYSKAGSDYLLMSNNARGVMKMPASAFTNASPIERMIPDTAGVKYETSRVVIVRGSAGLDLRTLPLP